MFFNHIKEFLGKKIVKKQLSNVKLSSSVTLIRTVGIVFDESHFYEKENLIKELVKKGFQEKCVKILVFRNIVNKKETFDYPIFSYADLSWSGNLEKKDAKEFINEPFDLLINYYDKEKSPLIQVSCLSKASFKVGFCAVDKRLNHFIIDTNVENYKIFIDELFKYLKILNKI